MNSVCSFILFGFLVTGLKAAQWSEWSRWERCSVTCGTGVRSSSRTCLSYGSGTCEGSSLRTSECRCTRECPPVNGGWSRWQNSSACSDTCGGGVRTRNRTCTNPTPAYGGLQCQGESHMSERCNENPCPVNGGWSNWQNLSACSVTCGGGVRTMNRTCDNPTPANGGLQCQGESHMSEHCNENPCPVNGGWSNWQNSSACSVTCGKGVRTRNRTCDNPPPANGGLQCQGESHMSEHCNENPCPVNGVFLAWEVWSPCSVTCGSGSRVRSRACIPPKYGGLNCTGPLFEINDCIQVPCQINGGWSCWQNSSACSVTCGGGVKTRTRTCNHPTAAYGGLQCRGKSQMIELCNENPCPVNGVSLAWGDWSPCSVTCGSGSRVRARACNPPQYGGHNCSEPLFEINNCVQFPCQTPPAGVACPTCTEDLECTWNTTCHVSENCMVRSISVTGFNFTTHCIMREDCLLLKMLAKTTHGEVFCCADENCVREMIG